MSLVQIFLLFYFNYFFAPQNDESDHFYKSFQKKIIPFEADFMMAYTIYEY